MMACRRLAREAVVASLRRGAAPARAFSSSSSTTATATSCSSRAPVAASPVRGFLARYSNPAFQPRAAEFGPSLAARVALGLRPKLSGLNLIKGIGTSTMLAMTLHQGQVTAATKEQPSKAIAGPPPGSLKTERGSFWPLVRKLQPASWIDFSDYVWVTQPVRSHPKYFASHLLLETKPLFNIFVSSGASS